MESVVYNLSVVKLSLEQKLFCLLVCMYARARELVKRLVKKPRQFILVRFYKNISGFAVILARGLILQAIIPILSVSDTRRYRNVEKYIVAKSRVQQCPSYHKVHKYGAGTHGKVK